MEFVIAPPRVVYLNVEGTVGKFPVRRVYCVGRNYSAHVREMNKGVDNRDPPFFFQKPRDSIVHSDTNIPYPSLTKSLHYEVELVVALSRGGVNIEAAAALGHVFGYAAGVDLTRRDLQTVAKEKSWPWEIAKSFDHSAPMGSLTRASNDLDANNCSISLYVNGDGRQCSNTQEMTWSVAEIISKLSEQNQLEPGDIIMTGTPEGVGALSRGDHVEAKIHGLQSLRFQISA